MIIRRVERYLLTLDIVDLESIIDCMLESKVFIDLMSLYFESPQDREKLIIHVLITLREKLHHLKDPNKFCEWFAVVIAKSVREIEREKISSVSESKAEK